MNIQTLVYIYQILRSRESVLYRIYQKDIESNAGENTISTSLEAWKEAKQALDDFESTKWWIEDLSH